MEEKKTVAEMLRKKPNGTSLECFAAVSMMGLSCKDMDSCMACYNETAEALADAIGNDIDAFCSRWWNEGFNAGVRIGEAKQPVDIAALDLLADKLEMGGESNRNTAMQIRAALNGAERSKTEHDGVIPEGIEWPRFESGELVRFGDEFIAPEYGENNPQKLTRLALYTEDHFPEGTSGALWEANYLRPGGAIGRDYRLKRPEPEVLDADGVPIKVGDTVWTTDGAHKLTVESIDYEGDSIDCGTEWIYAPSHLTHRKLDTQEAIDEDAAKEPCMYFNGRYLSKCSDCAIQDNAEVSNLEVNFDECRAAQMRDLLARQRKLLGGE